MLVILMLNIPVDDTDGATLYTVSREVCPAACDILNLVLNVTVIIIKILSPLLLGLSLF